MAVCYRLSLNTPLRSTTASGYPYCRVSAFFLPSPQLPFSTNLYETRQWYVYGRSYSCINLYSAGMNLYSIGIKNNSQRYNILYLVVCHRLFFREIAINTLGTMFYARITEGLYIVDVLHPLHKGMPIFLRRNEGIPLQAYSGV